MFSIGTSEIFVVMLVGLLVFGKRLPEVARSLGKAMAEFRRGLAGMQREFQEELMREDRPAPPSPAAAARVESAPSPSLPPPAPGGDAQPPAEASTHEPMP